MRCPRGSCPFRRPTTCPVSFPDAVPDSQPVRQKETHASLPLCRGHRPVFARVLSPAPAARACSICRCGDPTFNALGSNVYADGAFHFALDWDRLSKEQGIFDPHGEHGARLAPRHAGQGETETLVENRVTATLSYSFAERFNLVARIPYSFKTLTEGEEITDTHGFADPELYALVRLWSSTSARSLGRRTWFRPWRGSRLPGGKTR